MFHVPVTAVSQAKSKQIDVAVVFDVSNSMTQETYIYKVCRYSDGTGSRIHNVYDVVYDDQVNAPEESSADGVPSSPQHLRNSFDPDLRGKETGGRPGNVAGLVSLPAKKRVFTDLVAKITQSPFDGNAAVLCEASRGNLDNMENFVASGAAISGISASLVGVATRARYEALLNDHTSRDSAGRKGIVQLLHEASAVTKEFCTNLSMDGDIHFCFIPFATVAAGSASGDTIIDYARSEHYPSGGTISHTLKQVPLSKDSDQYSNVASALETVFPLYGTNSADALHQARLLLSDPDKHRPDAAQVCILITDGLPQKVDTYLINLNSQIPSSRFHMPNTTEQMVSDTMAESEEFAQRGIPIFAVGFLHSNQPQFVTAGSKLLTDVCNTAGHGSRFFLAQDLPELRRALDNINRHLITLEN